MTTPQALRGCASCTSRLDPSPSLDKLELAQLSRHEAKKCNFMCEVTRVGWDFAINAPKAKRHARVQGYLHTGKCSFWTLFTGRCGDGRDR